LLGFQKNLLKLPLVLDNDTISVLQQFNRWELCMHTVTVSPKFQVVIPQAIRKSLGLQPGQKVQAILYDNRIELIPIKPMASMRGFLKGIETTIERETDRL
jgi:AbrB family looped-hinge helix DNA binding protein